MFDEKKISWKKFCSEQNYWVEKFVSPKLFLTKIFCHPKKFHQKQTNNQSTETLYSKLDFFFTKKSSLHEEKKLFFFTKNLVAKKSVQKREEEKSWFIGKNVGEENRVW